MEITKEMSIMEIVTKYPQTAMVLMESGLGCLGCASSQFESLAEGAEVHRIDIDKLVQALNATVTLSV